MMRGRLVVVLTAAAAVGCAPSVNPGRADDTDSGVDGAKGGGSAGPGRDTGPAPTGDSALAGTGGYVGDAKRGAGATDLKPAPRLVDAGGPNEMPFPLPGGREPGEGTLPAVIPVVLLSVDGKAIPNEPKLAGRIKIIEEHDGTLANIANQPASLDAPMGIEYRGRTSGGFGKKSYGVELRDGLGMDASFPVLGMPKESDWVLYACWADKICLRNAIVYAIARELGRYYAPRARFAEVFLDGKYNGLYMVVEKTKRGKNRVDIAKPAETKAQGDLSGGYIVETDALWDMPVTGAVGWKSVERLTWFYKYPLGAEMTDDQKSYIQGAVGKFQALTWPYNGKNSANWADPTTGYQSLVDLGSLVDFAIMQELSNNVDGYILSLRMTKMADAAGGKFIMGPVWDFDITFGNVNYRYGMRTDVWAYQSEKIGTPLWWQKIWTDKAFANAFSCRWKEVRKDVITPERIDGKIDRWRKLLDKPLEREEKRWPKLGKNFFRESYVGKTYDDETIWLKAWIKDRIAWLDGHLPGQCP